MEIPKEFTDLIGTKQTLYGGLFGAKDEPKQEYDVLNCRWGSGQIMDLATGKIIHPTVELLVKRSGMRASRWTRGFACRSIKIEED